MRSAHQDESSLSERAVDLSSIADDMHIMRVSLSSRAAQLAAFLNSTDLRRDPWNISLPTELIHINGAVDEYVPPSSSSLEARYDPSQNDKCQGWAFMMQRSWDSTSTTNSSSSAHNSYYRAWNDPPLATIRDCFDMVQQLLEVCALSIYLFCSTLAV